MKYEIHVLESVDSVAAPLMNQKLNHEINNNRLLYNEICKRVRRKGPVHHKIISFVADFTYSDLLFHVVILKFIGAIN